MKDSEFKALVSLLDDDDEQVIAHVEERIRSLGQEVIPFLETEWESSLSPKVQRRIEELTHHLQFNLLRQRLTAWYRHESDDLLKGLWLVATYQYPDLDFLTLKQEMEQLYYEAWLEFKPAYHPADQVKLLNSVLFGKLKFSANTKNFHAPGNSMINVVLESKKGNPISLCAVYMLVAQRLKMPVYGVNLPNLFILTYKNEGQKPFYINAFNRGLIFSTDDITNYIGELGINPRKSFYEPCSHSQIVTRTLRNLINSFDKLGDHGRSEEVKTLLRELTDSYEL